MFSIDQIKDTESHFIIDPFTRTITNESFANNTIVQYDHNSERFTFVMPRYVDGFDMSTCGEVRVNYRNSASTGASKTSGIYICDDLAVSTEDEDKVTFSWLISSAATQYIGYLYFSIQFICFEGETVSYLWNTAVYKDIVVVESINNVEEAVASDSFKELTDLIFDAKATIAQGDTTIEAARTATEEANAAAEVARASVYHIRQTSDGKLQILDANQEVVTTVDTFCGDDDTLYRYVDGMLSVVGIKELNHDETYRIWVGTHDEYVALETIDPSTFYWITDDNTYEDAVNKFNAMATGLETGEFVVKKSETANNLKAFTESPSTLYEGVRLPGAGWYYFAYEAAEGGRKERYSIGVVYWDGGTYTYSPIGRDREKDIVVCISTGGVVQGFRVENGSFNDSESISNSQILYAKL